LSLHQFNQFLLLCNGCCHHNKAGFRYGFEEPIKPGVKDLINERKNAIKRLDFKQQQGYRHSWHRAIQKIKKILSRENTAEKDKCIPQITGKKWDLITS
jgi:hypothetical protein